MLIRTYAKHKYAQRLKEYIQTQSKDPFGSSSCAASSAALFTRYTKICLAISFLCLVETYLTELDITLDDACVADTPSDSIYDACHLRETFEVARYTAYAMAFLADLFLGILFTMAKLGMWLTEARYLEHEMDMEDSNEMTMQYLKVAATLLFLQPLTNTLKQ